jgi:anion-transporting  ArsA/GET3 family ATPase
MPPAKEVDEQSSPTSTRSRDGAAGAEAFAGTPVLERRCLMVAGKGGVGRTTVAAALARAAQSAGKRVLLAQMESADRLARLFGLTRPLPDEIVPVDDGLWAVNMTPRSALHEYALMVLKYESLYRALFENKAVRGFLGAVPGLDAYAMLGKAWFHTTETVGGRPRFDLVIIDGPASGHATRVLAIPQAILEAVPKGPLSRDAGAMRALLSDPTRFAFVMVTLPEELPARETANLAKEASQNLKLALAPLIVNGVPSARLSDPALVRLLEASAHAPPGATGAALAGTLAGARLLHQRRQDAEQNLERLRQDPGLPLIELPRLPATSLGPAEVAELAAVIANDPSFVRSRAAA